MLTANLSPQEKLFKPEVQLKFLEREIQVHFLLNAECDTVGVDILEMISDG